MEGLKVNTTLTQPEHSWRKTNAKKLQDDVDLSTPCSVEPTKVKEFAKPSGARKSLENNFAAEVPENLRIDDFDDEKLKPLLKQICRDVPEDEEYMLSYKERMLASRDPKHPLYNKEFDMVVKKYFDLHPMPKFGPDRKFKKGELKYSPFWKVLRKHGWKLRETAGASFYCHPDIKNGREALVTFTGEDGKVFENFGKMMKYVLSHRTEPHFLDIVYETFENYSCMRDNTPLRMDREAHLVASNGGDDFDAMVLDLFVKNSEKEEASTKNMTRKRAAAPNFGNLDGDKGASLLSSQSTSSSSTAGSTSKVTSQASAEHTGPKSKRAKIAQDMYEREKCYNFVWDLLKREQGWTHAPGNAIFDFSFLKPEIKNKSEGVEGKDYFVGENALLEYVESEQPDLIERYKAAMETEKQEREKQEQQAASQQKKQQNDHENRNNNNNNSSSSSRLVSKSSENRGTKEKKKTKRLSFARIWSLLKAEGWTYKPSPDPLKTFYYLFPGVRTLKEGRLGWNMFDDEEDVINFYYKFHKAPEEDDESDHSDDDSEEEEEEEEEEEQEQGKVQPKKQKKQQNMSKQKKPTKKMFEKSAVLNGLREKVPSKPVISFAQVWPVLQSKGWKYFKGSGLVSFIYAKPHVTSKATGELGVDMFASENEVVKEYIKAHGTQIPTQNEQIDLQEDSLQRHQVSKIAAQQQQQQHQGQSKSQKVQKTDPSKMDVDEAEIDIDELLDLDERLCDFVWSALRDEHGWIYKRGNKLHAFSFLKPPVTKKSDGVEGETLFTGYPALIRYVKRVHPELIDRYNNSSSSSSSSSSGGSSNSNSPANAFSQAQEKFPEPAVPVQKQVEKQQHKSKQTTSSRSTSHELVTPAVGSTPSSTNHDSALFDFVWGRLQSNYGWKPSFSMIGPDGSTQKVLVGEENLLKYVCNQHSSLILEYASQQKK